MIPSQNDICVIIPMYGFGDMTKKCVGLVKELAGMGVDILVVDDGSKEPYIDDSINVLRLDKNSGYTNATNQGILWCGDRYKYAHLLNNDITPHKDFIKVLYDFMETDPVTGIACSARVHEDGLETYGLDLICGHQVVIEDDKQPHVIFADWVPVCSGLVRMEMVRYIGLLDSQFINHCSDSEYCIRANRYKWNVALLTASVVDHVHRVTVLANDVNCYEDQKRFIAKLAGVKYQELMNRLPLDCGENLWGNSSFKTYKKNDNTDKPTTT